jgi:hypothetical protein
VVTDGAVAGCIFKENAAPSRAGYDGFRKEFTAAIACEAES